MTLKFLLEIKINLPLEKVTQLYANRDLYPRWQPGLISSELTASEPLTTYQLRFAFGRRRMNMTETILADALPHRYTVSHTMKGVYNRVENTFEAVDKHTTLWKCTTEFTFSGIKNLVARFMPDGFRQQTLVIMNNFKKYAEAHA